MVIFNKRENMNIEDISTDDLDYIKAEAERLPNGTAAKALKMMQPDTVTITISREAAKFVRDLCATLPIQEGSAVKVVAAIDASLEGER